MSKIEGFVNRWSTDDAPYTAHPIGIVLKKAVGYTYGSPTAIL